MEAQGLVEEEVERAVARFIVHEAMLLDAQRYEEWLDLLAPDVRYWIPITPDSSPDQQVSIAYDDKRRLGERVMSMRNGLGWAASPPPRICHILGGVLCDEVSPDSISVRSNQLVVAKPSRGPKQLHAGSFEYVLRPSPAGGAGFEIARKVIRLLDADEPFLGVLFLI